MMQAAPPINERQAAALRAFRRWGSLWGVALLGIGLYISALLIPDVVETAGGPQRLTLAQAARVAGPERTYASVEGGSWDCETLREVRGPSATSLRHRFGPLSNRQVTRYTEVFFTDSARDVVLFVTLAGEVRCADLAQQAPTGYLYTMSAGTRQELTDQARLARFFTANTFLEFCGYCGQSNSLIGAVFGGVFTLAGGALLATSLRLRRQERPHL
jgi:hypothetical protein